MSALIDHYYGRLYFQTTVLSGSKRKTQLERNAYSLIPIRRHVSIIMPQGIEKVTIQLKDTPKKIYEIGAKSK